MDAQQQHDHSRAKKLTLSGSRQRLEALLKAKNVTLSDWIDPYAQLLQEHPSLTREKITQMIEEYGF